MRTGRLAALVAVLTSLLALGSVSAASVSAASVSAASATPTRPATTRPGAGLFSVSCPAVSFCLAVGSHSGPAGRRHPLVEEWNGKSWRVLANPPGLALERVSCTSATFCAATGGPLGVGPADRSEFLTWNGHGWRPHPLPYGATSEISCGSRRYCVAIRYNTQIEAWHGVRWHPVPGTSPCSLGAANGCLLLDVSCASATVCMAIGSSPAAGNATESWAELYNGRRWTASVPPDTPLDFVACSGQGLCMATGNGADGYTPAAGWTQDSPGPSCGSDCDIAVPSISCTGLTNCMAVSSKNWTSYSWNGTGWETVSLAPAPTGPGFLDGVSCATATNCILVGAYDREGRTTAFTERWNGTTWKSVKTPSPS